MSQDARVIITATEDRFLLSVRKMDGLPAGQPPLDLKKIALEIQARILILRTRLPAPTPDEVGQLISEVLAFETRLEFLAGDDRAS